MSTSQCPEHGEQETVPARTSVPGRKRRTNGGEPVEYLNCGHRVIVRETGNAVIPGRWKS